MTRRPAVEPGEPLQQFKAWPTMTLLDMRDELNVVRDFLVVLCLANASPMHAGNGSALCTVANEAREKLEAVGKSIDKELEKARTNMSESG